MARLLAAGYRGEAPIVAVHEAETRKGALDRHLQQHEAFGRGRKIDVPVHDACHHGSVRAAGAPDAGPLAHSVFVVRRDASVVQGAHRGAGGPVGVGEQGGDDRLRRRRAQRMGNGRFESLPIAQTLS